MEIKRTSIIGAISKIFSEMYYINLKDNTIQKIASDDLGNGSKRKTGMPEVCLENLQIRG